MKCHDFTNSFNLTINKFCYYNSYNILINSLFSFNFLLFSLHKLTKQEN